MRLAVSALALAAGLAATAVARAQTAPPPRELPAVDQVVEILQRDLPNAPSAEVMLQAALRGLLRELDPEGDYFTAAEHRAQLRGPQQAASPGVRLGVRRGVVMVTALDEGGPAAGSDLRAGDSVLAVDGQPVLGLPHGRIAARLRGSEGSRLSITVLRGADPAPITVQLERRIVKPVPARAQVLAGDVLHLQLREFTDTAVAEVVALLRAQPEGLRGVLLDLRGNTGGLLDASIALAALFLPADAEVGRTVGASGETSATYVARPSSYTRSSRDPLATVPAALRRLPLVVLVDGGTSSGAEIVAGALRDHGRATLMGQPTFGSAGIQTLRMLRNGDVLRYTQARWLPPSGKSFEGQGLQPDIVLDGAAPQRALDDAVRQLRQRP